MRRNQAQSILQRNFWTICKEFFKACICETLRFFIFEHIHMLIYSISTCFFYSSLILFWKTQHQVDWRARFSGQDSTAAVGRTTGCWHCQWVAWNQPENHGPLVGKAHISCDRQVMTSRSHYWRTNCVDFISVLLWYSMITINSTLVIGIEMQIPQVWSTSSSYHTHGCCHAG